MKRHKLEFSAGNPAVESDRQQVIPASDRQLVFLAGLALKVRHPDFLFESPDLYIMSTYQGSFTVRDIDGASLTDTTIVIDGGSAKNADIQIKTVQQYEQDMAYYSFVKSSEYRLRSIGTFKPRYEGSSDVDYYCTRNGKQSVFGSYGLEYTDTPDSTNGFDDSNHDRQVNELDRFYHDHQISTERCRSLIRLVEMMDIDVMLQDLRNKQVQ